jgi:glycosyltransferase involved in cell wall biosynthesis
LIAIFKALLEEDYYNKKLNKLKKFHKRKNPKVSIISPLFNREKYISRFLKSIYYQNFDDFEIIFVDDHSIDNSIKLLEKYQKNDQRIILIKNKKNKGMFINRNLGVLFSNGKYTILPDPDDLLAKSSLKNLFTFAHKYNYDLIRFIIYARNENLTFKRIVNKLENRPIYQPELSTFIYYGMNELERIDCYIHNKFIKRGVYIKAINSLNKFYLNLYMTFMEDSIINFLLHRISESYFYYKIIGYYYIKNSDSITNNLFKISNLRINFIFNYLKFEFENSKNTKYEKDMNNFIFTNILKRFNLGFKLKISGNILGYIFYKEIIDKYINNRFILKENKELLNAYRNVISKNNRI